MNIDLSGISSDLKALAREWPLVFMFDLPPGAVIVVAGCYEGRVMDLLRQVYLDFGRMVGFDIQFEKAGIAAERFHQDPRVEVYDYGLGGIRSGEQVVVNYGTVDATVMTAAGSGEIRELRPAGRVFQDLGLEKIDLLVLNMEGYEFELLDYLIRHNWMSSIKRLAVQFHPQYKSLSSAFYLGNMDPTHRKIVDLYPQWVYWAHDA